MLHSMDRMAKKNEDKVEFMKNVGVIILAHLDSLPIGYFDSEEIIEIWNSAWRHGELNQNDQSITQQVLMDADRLANLMPAVIIRAGQFLPNIPTFEFEYLAGKRNPETTYDKPRSVLDNLRNLIAEYIPKLRTPKAKELAVEYVRTLEGFISALEESNKQLGLDDISL
ncbi:MAG: hypothetical protein UY07_C0004G0010 [Parcubacteria group bacterium GW2011_GWA1_47_8]|nr:MAG: hypothetical protein UY07_C0004G0010 [Parcubacteria group bacterium GW2011_GWA1_47_8]